MKSLKFQQSGSHYKQYKIQPIEFIHGNNIPFIEGNIIKKPGEQALLAKTVVYYTIKNCSVNGYVESTDNITSVFVTYLIEGIIEKCFALGEAYGPDNGAPTSGFVAVNEGIIRNCYSRVKVTGTGADGDAGFIWLANFGSVTENCYAACEMPTHPDQIDSNQNGFINSDNSSTITNCYYDTELSGKSDTGQGEPRSTNDMTYPYNGINTYISWNFVGIWDISPNVNDGYPYLRQLIIAGIRTAAKATFGLIGKINLLTSAKIRTEVLSNIFCKKDGEWAKANAFTKKTIWKPVKTFAKKSSEWEKLQD